MRNRTFAVLAAILLSSSVSILKAQIRESETGLLCASNCLTRQIKPFDIDLSQAGIQFTIQVSATDTLGNPYLLMFTPYEGGYAALVNLTTGLAQIQKADHIFTGAVTWPGNIKTFGWIMNGGIWARDWPSNTAWVPMPGFTR